MTSRMTANSKATELHYPLVLANDNRTEKLTQSAELAEQRSVV
jgi:hypothetical protein